MNFYLCALIHFLHITFGVFGEAWAECLDKRDCSYPSLANATADELQNGLQKGCFTSVDMVNAYVKRINEVNSTLHMVLEINQDALDIARGLDKERENGKLRGPLHGHPVLLKETIGTQDEMSTSAGSYALIDAKVRSDSTIAANLRKNGLVILGKTSLTEWQNVRSTNSSNGWNAQGGQTYGAYYQDQDPNGSSSGSAVGADLGLALAALALETSGSILLPASVSNVVGIKPTVGLTSRYMVIPVSQHQDTVGPLARTVKDAAKVLQSIAGADPNDNYTQASPYGNDLPDYAATCKPSGLKGKRIGVPQNVIAQWATDDNAAVRSAFDKAVSTMSEAGAIIIDDTNFTAYDNYTSSPAPQEVVAIDFKSDIAEYISNLKTNPNKIYDLADISNFTKHNPLEDYPSRNIETWNLVLGVPINNTSPEFWAMYQQNLYFGGEGGVLGAISRHKLDAVILPTAIGFQIPALVGSPAITVPLGSMPDGSPIRKNARGDLVESAPGIPFGISFLGELWSEEMLIEMAYAFEQRTLHRGKIHHYIEPKAELKNNK